MLHIERLRTPVSAFSLTADATVGFWPQSSAVVWTGIVAVKAVCLVEVGFWWLPEVV